MGLLYFNAVIKGAPLKAPNFNFVCTVCPRSLVHFHGENLNTDETFELALVGLSVYLLNIREKTIKKEKYLSLICCRS